jgi:LacI family transcriptional regulator
MRTSRTGNIGLLVSRLLNPLHPALLHVLGRVITQAGFRMVVWSTDEMDEAAAADAVRGSLVDGVIMTRATTNSRLLYEAVQLKAPVVLVNCTMEGWPCDQVAGDNLAGGRTVAEYLLKAGRRRIGLVAGLPLPSNVRERQAGFRDVLSNHGRGLDEALCQQAEQFSYNAGFEAATRLLDLAEPPDALFCVNDVLALGARDAARHRGFDVPGDLWIVGYDDIEMVSWFAFDLTTIRQPLEQMAQIATDFLLERINGYEGEYRSIRLPNDLVIRGSTSRQKAR